MKKKKLFTVLVAAALLTTTGASLTEANTPVAQAATKKSKKTTKKNYKNPTVSIKKGATLYKITFNKKGTAIKKIAPMKQKGRKLTLKAVKMTSSWSTKYKGVSYYYLGGNYAVRTKDAKVVSKKKVPTLTSLQREAKNKAIADYQKRASDWQSKIDAAKPKTYPAKVTTESGYFIIDTSTGKGTKSTSNLPVGTTLTVLYKDSSAIQSNDGKSIEAYFARTSDNKYILIPVAAVTLDDASANVSDSSQYKLSVKNANDLYEQAKKDLNIKDNN